MFIDFQFVVFAVITEISCSTNRILNRIVGGKEAQIDDFPYQMSIRRNNFHICGGAIIRPRYGLSAAHCFEKRAVYTTRLGSSYKDSGGTIMAFSTIILHPLSYRRDFQYDLAILEFQSPVHTIQPVNLPLSVPKLGDKGLISGYGDVRDNGNTGSMTLRAVEVAVKDSKVCGSKYAEYKVDISSRLFCAGSTLGDKDSCQGDSGGPFVINNVLYGIVSFGLKCADPYYPGVYINVANFRNYLNLNLKD